MIESLRLYSEIPVEMTIASLSYTTVIGFLVVSFLEMFSTLTRL